MGCDPLPHRKQYNMENHKLDIPAYLERIGCSAPISLTPEGLHLLTTSHLKSVPFENLEVTDEGAEPSLDAEALFRKVVEKKRGGYCFELNKLFALLLSQLGFECRSVAVRVINGRPDPCPLSHRGIVVTIGGKRYYCDVGFGGEGPKDVLPLDEGSEQTVAGEHFHLSSEGDAIVISKYKDGRAWRVLKFRDESWLDVDFVTLNRYYSTYPGSPFRLKRIIYLSTEEGWKSLVHHTFTRFSGGAYTVTQLEPEQIRELVKQEFHLEIP